MSDLKLDGSVYYVLVTNDGDLPAIPRVYMTDITDKDGNPPPKLLSSPEAHWRGLEVGKYPTLPVRGSDFQAGLLLLCTKPEDPTFLAVYPIDHKVIGFSLFGFPSRQIEIRMTVVTECKSEDSKRGNEKRARFALVPDGAEGYSINRIPLKS